MQHSKDIGLESCSPNEGECFVFCFLQSLLVPGGHGKRRQEWRCWRLYLQISFSVNKVVMGRQNGCRKGTEMVVVERKKISAQHNNNNGVRTPIPRRLEPSSVATYSEYAFQLTLTPSAHHINYLLQVPQVVPEYKLLLILT
jgi:hypothetical protein